MKDNYLQINGRKVHLVEIGQGKPLVLLHGLFVCGEIFKPLIPRLQENFRMFIPDLPGFGNSDELAGKHTFENYAAFLDQLFDQLELKKPIIFGCSMGGTIGLTFASIQPDHLSRLSIQGAPFYCGELGISERDLLMLNLYKHWSGFKKVFRFLTTNEWFWSVFKLTDTNLRQAIKELDSGFLPKCFQHLSERTLIEVVESFLKLDLRSRLPKIKAPVQIITGAKDKVVPPAAARDLHNLLPNSSLAIIPKEDHEILIDNPELFLEKLLPFLRS